MDNFQHIQKLAGLISKNILQDMSSEEKEQLNSWKSKSDRNEKLFQQVSSWSSFQEREKLYQSFDGEEAWKQFVSRRDRSKVLFPIRSFIKYAAVILLPLLFGGIIFYYLGREQVTEYQEITSITPGSQNAMIVLADGKTVDLTKGGANQLVEEDGSVIRNEKGELSYSSIERGQTKEVLKNTLIVPRGGEYSLVLSDGSKVYLNSVSKLTYPVTFNDAKREVTLEGEAYFEIEKDEKRPFVVNIDGLKIEVLGTSFNVKAYADEEQIYTTLVEGKVKLNVDNDANEWILSPYQQAVLDLESQNIKVREVDVEQFVGWKNGVYYFTNQSIVEVVKTLSRWYDFEYEFADETVKQVRFEGGLNKYEDIYPVLEIMQTTRKLKYKIEGKKIVFIQN